MASSLVWKNFLQKKSSNLASWRVTTPTLWVRIRCQFFWGVGPQHQSINISIAAPDKYHQNWFCSLEFISKWIWMFLEYCQQNFLVQYCLTPTRGENILDLILTNNQILINNYTTKVNQKFSDNYLLKVWLNFSFTQDIKTSHRKYPSPLWSW